MNFLKQIFTEENTAYIGLCKFKMAKSTVTNSLGSIKFTPHKEFYKTNFSKNILL